MKKKIIGWMIVCALYCSLIGMANATVLTFEGEGYDMMTSMGGKEYGGLIWDSEIICYTEDFYLSEINMHAYFPSSSIAVGNYYGYNRPPVSIFASEGLVSFHGVYFTAFSEFGPSAEDIIMEGYLDGQMLYSVAHEFGAQFAYCPAEFAGIDRLTLHSTTGQKMWLMDNMSVCMKTVPEPATLVLLGTGLGYIAAKRRTRPRIKKHCQQD